VTAPERIVLALTIFGEARGEPIDGQLAVASVIGNRVADGRWGRSYTAVCLAPYQFSCWNTSDPNKALLDSLAAQCVDPSQAATLRANTVLQRCLWIADGLLAGVVPSTVRHATHYYATTLRDTPRWAKVGTLVGRVGNHVFFEHVT